MHTPLREQFKGHPDTEQSGPEKSISHRQPTPPIHDPCRQSERCKCVDEGITKLPAKSSHWDNEELHNLRQSNQNNIRKNRLDDMHHFRSRAGDTMESSSQSHPNRCHTGTQWCEDQTKDPEQCIVHAPNNYCNSHPDKAQAHIEIPKIQGDKNMCRFDNRHCHGNQKDNSKRSNRGQTSPIHMSKS